MFDPIVALKLAYSIADKEKELIKQHQNGLISEEELKKRLKALPDLGDVMRAGL